MENEAGEVGVIASIIHTCGRRGSCEQQEAWAGAGVRHCGSRLEGFLSSVSPGRLPGVALCEAGPKGGSAYLADWSGRRPQRIGATSWQGSMQHCPTPELLPAPRGGRQGGNLCEDPDLSLDLALHKLKSVNSADAAASGLH